MSNFNERYVSASGLVFWLDPNTKRTAALPGIDLNNRPPYKRVFFGAEREWANEDEGWTYVGRNKRRGSKKCKIQDDQYTVA